MGFKHNQHYHKVKHWVQSRVPFHYQVAVIAWMSRLISAGAQLVSVAIILRYLGTHSYALFALMTGLQGWFVLADLGFGSSVQNAISKARVQQKDITAILSNTFILLAISTFCFLFLYPVVSFFLQQIIFRKIDPELAHGHYELFVILGITYIVTSIWSVIYRVLLATRQGYWAYIYQGLGPILSLFAIGFIYFIPYHGVHRLLAMLIAWIAPPALVAIVSSLWHFPLRRIKGSWNNPLLALLFHQAMQFSLINIIVVVTTSIDYVVMSQTVNADQIAIYNILAKGFGVIYFVYMAVLLALWPEVAELFEKKQWLKANHWINRNLLFGIGFVGMSTIGVIIFKRMIIYLLAPDSHLILPISSIVLFGFSYALTIWISTFSMALQSQNHLRACWPAMSLQALFTLPATYCFSIYFGINGIILGLILAQLFSSAWMLPVIYLKRRVLYE